MISRRDLIQLAAATAALPGVFAGASSGMNRALAQQKITQEELLRFEPLGQVTLLHFADIHAQLVPLFFREPSVNLGVGAARGKPPHLTGGDFLREFGIAAGTAQASAERKCVSRRLDTVWPYSTSPKAPARGAKKPLKTAAHSAASGRNSSGGGPPSAWSPGSQ